MLHDDNYFFQTSFEEIKEKCFFSNMDSLGFTFGPIIFKILDMHIVKGGPTGLNDMKSKLKLHWYDLSSNHFYKNLIIPYYKIKPLFILKYNLCSLFKTHNEWVRDDRILVDSDDSEEENWENAQVDEMLESEPVLQDDSDDGGESVL